MIHPSVKVTSNDAMAKRLEEALKKAAGLVGTVGVHSDAGQYANRRTTPAQTAIWNEFGTANTPARPFMAPALDDNRGLIATAHQQAVQNVLHGWAPEKALLKFAFLLQVLIQNKIKSNVQPPLSGVYKGPKAAGYLGRKYLQRQPARTLIATGLLLRSIRAYITDAQNKRVAASPEKDAGFGAPELSAAELRDARTAARAAGAQRKAAARAARLRTRVAADRDRLVGDSGD